MQGDVSLSAILDLTWTFSTHSDGCNLSNQNEKQTRVRTIRVSGSETPRHAGRGWQSQVTLLSWQRRPRKGSACPGPHRCFHIPGVHGSPSECALSDSGADRRKQQTLQGRFSGTLTGTSFPVSECRTPVQVLSMPGGTSRHPSDSLMRELEP